MPTVTRHAVFETNSSSSHSIHIEHGVFNHVSDFPWLLDNRRDGAVQIYYGEFGWEPEAHTTLADRASYALTWAASYGDSVHLEMLRRVLEAEFGHPVEFCESRGCYPTGYIDHQSSEVAAPAFADEKTLRSFIFNTKSWVRTDNDNH